MEEEFSFDVSEGCVEKLKSVIDEELIAIRNRFYTNRETEKDLLYQYPHMKLKCELKNKKEVDLDIVEEKYYKKLISLVEKKDKIIDLMAEELADWYMDNRIDNRKIDKQYVINKFTNKIEEE